MQEVYTGFELAKRLKEKGFPQDSRCRFNKDGKMVFDFPNPSEENCSAVPLSVAQKWLREMKHIHCEVHYEMILDRYRFTIDNCNTKTASMPDFTFNNYEDALIQALLKALKQI